MNTALCAQLTKGNISVQIDSALIDPREIFGFAERINPKRAFLFVSKVLGRHIAVRPQVVEKTFETLASQIDAHLPGPILFIGMAETAIGLGAGVHEKYCEISGRRDALFLCTTRHDLNQEKLCEFSEDHSHATQHIVFKPRCTEHKRLLANARSVVLVDDESSTGNTFANLYAALPKDLTDKVERITIVTLTDWSGGDAMRKLPGKVDCVSLVKGRYAWTPKSETTKDITPADEPVASEPKIAFVPRIENDWGRLGVINHGSDLPLPKNLSGQFLFLERVNMSGSLTSLRAASNVMAMTFLMRPSRDRQSQLATSSLKNSNSLTIMV